MTERTVEDKLREEYFALLPEARLALEELETRVRHSLLPLTSKLDKFEQLVVTSRIKDCESALDAVRRRQEGGTFDPERFNSYTLRSLNDLAGVRVLAFPRTRWKEANKIMRRRFSSWIPDPVRAEGKKGMLLAFKYHGHIRSGKVQAELQIGPMLIGLFWQIEHSTIYKPSPQLKGVAESLAMKQLTKDIYKSFRAFEGELERLIQHDRHNTR